MNCEWADYCDPDVVDHCVCPATMQDVGGVCECVTAG